LRCGRRSGLTRTACFRWGPSPWDAVVEFVAMNRGAFERDTAREFRYGATQSMFGFLRRTGSGEHINNPMRADENPYTDL
jgi:hypothetical protein